MTWASEVDFVQADMLPSQRHLFDIPRDVCYLNAAYMTPAPLASTAAGVAALNQRQHPWTVATNDFFTESEATRARFARIIGSEADDIALVPAVSYGIAVAARNLDVNEGQVIVTLADQFPSNVYPWRRLAEARGGEVVTVTCEPGGGWTAALLSVLDLYGERVAIVACPQYHWATGAPVDLVAVATAAHDVEAAVVLDLTQSLGAAPFDLAAVDPDFVAVAGYKWMFGPYTYAYLYVAPRHQDGEPLEENWIARAGSEDFARLVDYQDRYQPGARRFDCGERSNFSLTPIAHESLRQIEEWTVSAIAATLNRLNDRIGTLFSTAGFDVPGRDQRGPHLMGVSAPGGLDPATAAQLRNGGVEISVRGDSVRIAPHLYVDDVDLERLAACLASL